jgi:hypothetical protein
VGQVTRGGRTVLEQRAGHPVAGTPIRGIKPHRLRHDGFHNDIVS